MTVVQWWWLLIPDDSGPLVVAAHSWVLVLFKEQQKKAFELRHMNQVPKNPVIQHLPWHGDTRFT